MKTCDWFCKKHNLQCKRLRGHEGLHLCNDGCSGAKGYGMNDKEHGAYLGFEKTKNEDIK